jgi:N6-adenosine-specific RNA methylase IME4
VAPEDEAACILTQAVARRNLSASQRTALAVECAQYHVAINAGRQRRLANLTSGPDVATLPHRRGRTRDRAAEMAGVSARTIQDAATVGEASPELFEEVLAGRIPVERAAQQVRRATAYAAIPLAPPVPRSPFGLILADPPWQMGAPTSASCPDNHYPTMALADIEGMEVPAADHAVLVLWAVNSLLGEALTVMSAWGFAYKANLWWVKPSIGPGNWARQRHELVIIGTRGTIRTPREEDRPDSVIGAPHGRHSAKPEALYERIERAYPQLSKCELFARGTHASVIEGRQRLLADAVVTARAVTRGRSRPLAALGRWPHRGLRVASARAGVRYLPRRTLRPAQASRARAGLGRACRACRGWRSSVA